MASYYLTVIYILAGVVGLCVGSFLNVVIYRLPLKMSISQPPSHCPKCDYKLHWYDNIPIISYCMLGGKCRNCKTHISFRYTFVEAANTVLWLLSVYTFYSPDTAGIVKTLAAMIASSVCLCIAFIDIDHMTVNDRFVLTLLTLGILVTVFDGKERILSHILGAVCVTAVFVIVALAASKKYGKDALGGGDVKLAFVFGLYLGWESMLFSVLVSSVVGSIVLLTMKKMRNDEDRREYPFAPFLVFGFLTALFFGEIIITWYMSLIGA